MLWKKKPFDFSITRKRQTKLGDYRYLKSKNHHKITVNGDLNPYSFLVTYIHEYAHLYVQVNYKSRLMPHGLQWKKAFRELMQPMLNESIFPKAILLPLQKHMDNPKASSHADPKLYFALKQFDNATPADASYLYMLTTGEKFQLNGRFFKVIQQKRTRVLCKDLKNGKNYLVSKMVETTALH